MSKICSGINKNGLRCKKRTMAVNGLCHVHKSKTASQELCPNVGIQEPKTKPVSKDTSKCKKFLRTSCDSSKGCSAPTPSECGAPTPSECEVPTPECPACYEIVNEKPLVCGHYAHIGCIKKSMKSECFLCRKALELPKKIMDCIEEHAKEAQQEWEEDIEDEMRSDTIQNIFNHMIMSCAFDVMRSGCTCTECLEGERGEIIEEEIILAFSQSAEEFSSTSNRNSI